MKWTLLLVVFVILLTGCALTVQTPPSSVPSQGTGPSAPPLTAPTTSTEESDISWLQHPVLSQLPEPSWAHSCTLRPGTYSGFQLQGVTLEQMRAYFAQLQGAGYCFLVDEAYYMMDDAVNLSSELYRFQCMGPDGTFVTVRFDLTRFKEGYVKDGVDSKLDCTIQVFNSPDYGKIVPDSMEKTTQDWDFFDLPQPGTAYWTAQSDSVTLYAMGMTDVLAYKQALLDAGYCHNVFEDWPRIGQGYYLYAQKETEEAVTITLRTTDGIEGGFPTEDSSQSVSYTLRYFRQGYAFWDSFYQSPGVLLDPAPYGGSVHGIRSALGETLFLENMDLQSAQDYIQAVVDRAQKNNWDPQWEEPLVIQGQTVRGTLYVSLPPEKGQTTGMGYRCTFRYDPANPDAPFIITT